MTEDLWRTRVFTIGLSKQQPPWSGCTEQQCDMWGNTNIKTFHCTAIKYPNGVSHWQDPLTDVQNIFHHIFSWTLHAIIVQMNLRHWNGTLTFDFSIESFCTNQAQRFHNEHMKSTFTFSSFRMNHTNDTLWCFWVQIKITVKCQVGQHSKIY